MSPSGTWLHFLSLLCCGTSICAIDCQPLSPLLVGKLSEGAKLKWIQESKYGFNLVYICQPLTATSYVLFKVVTWKWACAVPFAISAQNSQPQVIHCIPWTLSIFFASFFPRSSS